MHGIANRIWRTRPNAAGIQVELTSQSLRPRVLLADVPRRLKHTALCLFCMVCLGAQAASGAENAPVREAATTSAQQPAQQPVLQNGRNSVPPVAPTTGPDTAAAGSPVEVRELWTGSLYSSTYRVGVCFSAQGTVRGVVQLRLYNGKVDVYHIDGTVQNNDVEAHHSSGHKFKGRLVSADSVEGDISLKNGMNVRLEGKRTHGVELAPEDCAPLGQ